MKYSYYFCVDGRGALRLFVTFNKKRFSYSLGYSVDPDKWNTTSQRVKRNTYHGKKQIPAARINAAIQHYEDTLQVVVNSCTSGTTTEQFKSDLDSAFNRKKETDEHSFFDLYSQYIKEESVECGWSQGTIYKHKRLYDEWKMFRPAMSINDINEDTLNQFKDYQIEIGHQNETVKKKISMSKWFFRWLVLKGILTDTSFSVYKAKLKRANRQVVFLTWEELMRVYTHQFPAGGYLDRVRDVFCFCCFSSLRYSDAYALKKKDIYDGAIHIVTQKTNDKLTIELNNYTTSILTKYNSLKGDKALPVISNQKMNAYLKEVCKQCDINEKLTDIYYKGSRKYEVTKEKWQMVGTHSGRRTFICNALMLGIAPNIVMKWTGHSDYKSMKPYIDIADSAKKSAMQLFNK